MRMMIVPATMSAVTFSENKIWFTSNGRVLLADLHVQIFKGQIILFLSALHFRANRQIMTGQARYYCNHYKFEQMVRR